MIFCVLHKYSYGLAFRAKSRLGERKLLFYAAFVRFFERGVGLKGIVDDFVPAACRFCVPPLSRIYFGQRTLLQFSLFHEPLIPYSPQVTGKVRQRIVHFADTNILLRTKINLSPTKISL
jgi:hypothetical protein